MLKNLTWRTAAKWYIWVVGMAATFAATQADLPDWVPAALAVATAVASWAKAQYPEPAPPRVTSTSRF